MDYQKITELLVKLILLSRQESVSIERRMAASEAFYLYSELIDRRTDSVYYNQIKNDFIKAMELVKYNPLEYLNALN